MKKALTLLILFIGINQSFGQDLSYDDFKSLIPYLKAEDWKSAFNESSKLLKSTQGTLLNFMP